MKHRAGVAASAMAMPGSKQDWRLAPSAARRYGDGCRCHPSAQDHLFDRNLECRGCQVSWYDYQDNPGPCPRPVDHGSFTPLDKRERTT